MRRRAGRGGGGGGVRFARETFILRYSRDGPGRADATDFGSMVVPKISQRWILNASGGRRKVSMRRPEIHLSHACACTTTHLHDGGQPDGAVPEDRQALVGAPEIAAPADHGHAAVRGHFPRAYLVPEEGQDVGGRTDPSHSGIGQGPREGGRFGEEAVPCMRLFSFFGRERERRDSRVLAIGTLPRTRCVFHHHFQDFGK